MRVRSLLASVVVVGALGTAGLGSIPVAMADPVPSPEESTTLPTGSRDTEAISVAISSGAIALQVDSDEVDFAASTSTVNEAGETLVMLPLRNIGSEYSNVLVALDESGQILNYAESHFTSYDEKSGHAKIWQDGELTVDGDFSDEDAPLQTRGVGDAISALNDCLSAAGIPAWVVAAATAVCSFGSLPGYIACLTAAGVGGGTAGYCAAAAWDAL